MKSSQKGYVLSGYMVLKLFEQTDNVFVFFSFNKDFNELIAKKKITEWLNFALNSVDKRN